MLSDCSTGEDSWESLELQGDQSILKEINPEYSLEKLMLKLTLQYFGHLMRRADSLEKTLMLGKTEGKRRREQQRMNWWYSITNSMDMNLSKLWEIVEDRGAWSVAVHGAATRQTQLSDWMTKTMSLPLPLLPGFSLLYTTSQRWIDWVLLEAMVLVFSLLICRSRL